MVNFFVNALTRPIVRQYAVVITVNIWVMTFGMGLAWPSPVLVKLRDENQTVLPQPITDEEGSWVVSIGLLVSVASIFLPAALIDIVGRKYSILLGCIPKITGVLLFIFASEVWMLILGRAFNSTGDVFVMAVVPTYSSEIASKQVRGSLGTIFQIASSLGILIMLSMGPFVSYLVLNIVFLTFIIVAAIPVLFLPDTPYFLHSKGKTEEAIKVLTFLRGSEQIAAEELKEYSSASTDTDAKVDKRQLFKNKVFVKALILVIIFGAGGQLVGFVVVSFYLQTILESTQTNISDEIGSVIIGAIQVLAAVVAMVISDRFGRKPILSTTFIGTSCGMFGLGVFFLVKDNQGSVTGFTNVLPLLSIILVVFCHSCGFGSVSWILQAELFEGPGRGIGVSAAIQSSLIFGFLITKYFSALTTSIGPVWTYWMFGIICIVFCIFTVVCIPETKGKTFAEIQIALGAKGHVIDAKDSNCSNAKENIKV